MEPEVLYATSVLQVNGTGGSFIRQVSCKYMELADLFSTSVVQVHGTGCSSNGRASCTEMEPEVIISKEPPHGTGMDLTFSIKERSILFLRPFVSPS